MQQEPLIQRTSDPASTSDPAGTGRRTARLGDPAFLRREFTHVRKVATFYNGLGVSDDEQGVPRSTW
jgi:hypothetical protein